MKTKMRRAVNKSSGIRLAIDGGKPIRTAPWGKGPYHFPSELKRLAKVLAGPALPLAQGLQVRELRERLGRLYGMPYVVTASSGTAAIHAALAAAGVGPGDEVVLSPLTDFGSVAGILTLGATAVFADTAPHSYGLDPADLERLLTKRTKAVIAIHIAGYACEVKKIAALAHGRGASVVEDCAQAHLARLGGRYLGTFGDFGCFSTNESKHMKSGEGGFILTRREAQARYAELYADKCYDRRPGVVPLPSFPALNLRMSEVNAAIAIEQLGSLPARIARRNVTGRRLAERLAPYPLMPVVSADNDGSAFWWFAFHLEHNRTTWTTPEFAKALSAEGIPCGNHTQRNLARSPLFDALDRNPAAFPTYRPVGLKKGFYRRPLPNADWVYENMLRVECSEHLWERDAADFGRALDKLFSSRP